MSLGLSQGSLCILHFCLSFIHSFTLIALTKKTKNTYSLSTEHRYSVGVLNFYFHVLVLESRDHTMPLSHIINVKLTIASLKIYLVLSCTS